MIMSHFWNICAIISLVSALILKTGAETGSALIQGAASAVTTAVAIAGPLSLWTGIGKWMERLGINEMLCKPVMPVLQKLYPSTKHDSQLAGTLSGNFCANLLGLGNAATPMGIQSVKRMINPISPERATDEMCRLVIMNTASIQLIPTTVAAVRTSTGCSAPFDILPCVWISSIISVSAGLLAGELFRRWGKFA